MNVLVVAPHADDEVLGCGGAIAKHTMLKNDTVYLCIVTNGKPPLFDNTEAIKHAWPHNNFLETNASNLILGVSKTFYLDFPAVMLEKAERYELNDALIEVMKQVMPDIVYIPHIGDMQKDHQIVAEAMMVACRPKYSFAPKRILAYETLSETGWNTPNVNNSFIPNVFCDISEFLEKKTEAMRKYGSQLGRFPDARSLEAIEALARFRGALVNKQAAEAFAMIRDEM